MSERYVCIHGHFYQPPRENAWLEEIEQQVTAYPFHDWNERITHECYGPNAEARVLDGAGRLRRVCSNYARISYNFGPTLLSWMERAAPRVHGAIVAADRASAARFGGHGSAMAQGYNHIIMPLASERDRRTQTRWGVADFVHRFGRRPEGMWLPECAADVPTLETLAAEGIAFTVMAPGQCAATRPLGQWRWDECGPGGPDPRRAYRVALPSGRSIAVFFYDGPIAQAVAFERLLDDGRRLAGRLLGAFGQGDGPGAQLVHIATDGESYGHHHRFGEMALASALDRIEADPGVRLTNYAEFLARQGTAAEALVREPSAWSCAHGVGRWCGACGCGTGENPGWSQAWRGPLRDALDWLRDELAGAFEAGSAGLLRDPWAARDGYVAVLLRPGARSRAGFLAEHAARPLSDAEARRAMELLESQRQAMLMFTSCAWFFDELSGIETVQVLQYAARAMELVESATGLGLGDGFATRLALAQSNAPERGTGADVLGALVMPGRVGPERVLASEMVRRVAERDGEPIGAGVWEVAAQEPLAIDRGSTRLRAGTARVVSVRTGHAWELEYGLIVHGERLVRCGVGVAG
ncbi:MAG: glycoside hydrolase, partial [Planctomyces sp.]|nr:glycoside hydrolase [Planctomyces sp.]